MNYLPIFSFSLSWTFDVRQWLAFLWRLTTDWQFKELPHFLKLISNREVCCMSQSRMPNFWRTSQLKTESAMHIGAMRCASKQGYFNMRQVNFPSFDIRFCPASQIRFIVFCCISQFRMSDFEFLTYIAITYKALCCKSQFGKENSVAYRSLGCQTLMHFAVRNSRCVAI